MKLKSWLLNFRAACILEDYASGRQTAHHTHTAETQSHSHRGQLWSRNVSVCLNFTTMSTKNLPKIFTISLKYIYNTLFWAFQQRQNFLYDHLKCFHCYFKIFTRLCSRRVATCLVVVYVRLFIPSLIELRVFNIFWPNLKYIKKKVPRRFKF